MTTTSTSIDKIGAHLAKIATPPISTAFGESLARIGREWDKTIASTAGFQLSKYIEDTFASYPPAVGSQLSTALGSATLGANANLTETAIGAAAERINEAASTLASSVGIATTSRLAKQLEFMSSSALAQLQQALRPVITQPSVARVIETRVGPPAVAIVESEPSTVSSNTPLIVAIAVISWLCAVYPEEVRDFNAFVIRLIWTIVVNTYRAGIA